MLLEEPETKGPGVAPQALRLPSPAAPQGSTPCYPWENRRRQEADSCIQLWRAPASCLGFSLLGRRAGLSRYVESAGVLLFPSSTVHFPISVFLD